MASWSFSFLLVIFFCRVLVTELLFLRKMLSNSTNFFRDFFFFLVFLSYHFHVYVSFSSAISVWRITCPLCCFIYDYFKNSFLYSNLIHVFNSAQTSVNFIFHRCTYMCGNYHHKRFLSVRVVWIRMNILGFKVQLLCDCAWIWFLSCLFSFFFPLSQIDDDSCGKSLFWQFIRCWLCAEAGRIVELSWK